MRVLLVVAGLTILVSMGLALIVFGQPLTEAKLTLQNLHLDQMQQARVNQLKERQWVENLLKGQLDSKKKNVEEMEAEVKKLTEEEGKKKTEVEACQAEKKQKEEVLAPIQKEQSDIEVTFKTEKEAWTGEITTLKQQLEQRSKVCGFVKDSTDTAKLCPPKEGAAKAEAAPVKAEAAPVKAEAAPVKAEVAPVKAEAAPVKAEAAPLKAEAAPVKAEAALVKAEAAPVKAEAAPVKAEAAPVKAE
ncbi:neurofilament heavy polypeptide-like isoform X11 [Oncorhynchus keta]|uniref:neurofilament heavy polypeptide-like isoform X10 n=1 Tax=Oncorhynchus keta TaxID=8018 RepID=UPI00227BB247|nr:neurofilament heavy polypeptide-like isoform X10 [Oncorhynchus keta]XP_052349515.1 neurofilament heavy polypeptide-like isoform X11 [Oncorhynchus keta]